MTSHRSKNKKLNDSLMISIPHTSYVLWDLNSTEMSKTAWLFNMNRYKKYNFSRFITSFEQILN